MRLAVAVTACAVLIGGLAGPATAATRAVDTIGGDGLAGDKRAVQLLEGADPLPNVKAASWVLADADTGVVLAHKGAHVQRAPASTLKMLTAVTLLPTMDLEATTRASSRAASIYGTRVGLRAGKSYTLDDLWYAVFLPSANDAAIAVAEANGGVKRTVRQMNKVAYDLRALDTVAKTPNGLDSPGQRTSAYDLALIAREGLRNEDFARYASTAKTQFPNTKGKGTHTIYTTNRMLLHGWRGAIGVKTGFTSQAGRTFAGAAKRHGRTLIVTLLGIQESTETAAKKLLAWGFKNADRVEPVGVLVDRGSPLPESLDTPSGGGDAGATALDPTAGEPAESTTEAAGVTDEALAASEPIESSPGLPVFALIAAGLIAAGAFGLVALRRSPSGRHSA